MNRQFLAGAYSDLLLNAVNIHHKDKAIRVTRDLLHSLSFFEADIPAGQIEVDQESPLYSILSVFHNYLHRGLPTHTNIQIEEYLKDTWGNIKITKSNTGNIEYGIPDVSKEFTELLARSLVIIDPRIGREALQTPFWHEVLGSELESRFIQQHLIPILGTEWLQIIEPQRYVSNILKYAYESGEFVRELYKQPIDQMDGQRVDFAIEAPCRYDNDDRLGLIIEIDGSQHLYDRAQFNLDQFRDTAMACLESTNWATLRASSEEWHLVPRIIENFSNFFTHRYFKRISDNYHNPLWNQPDGIKALNLALTPIAVARIQRVVLQLILQGELSMDSPVWKIGIIERDVDCAWIAIEDFKDIWKRFNDLAGTSIILPEIELAIYSTLEFNSQNIKIRKKQLDEVVQFQGDVLLDLSVLQRWGLSSQPSSIHNVKQYTIRSAHSKKALRTFKSANLINYPSFLEEHEYQTDLFLDRIQNLTYFVQSVFRKQSLRPGQLPIINKALQNESVIGLLPTGGGKSLTYQLCALLQPGITIIVDPIKSLMQDQNEGLLRNRIDATIFINSSIRTYYERQWAVDQLEKARVLFAFISPERLQIPEFRTALTRMSDPGGNYFSYCIIDEAHCVSEWGHDFRTSYLRLGENARKYCKSKNKKVSVPLFGLTATASFDVLADVKRELNIGNENVVSSLTSHREELMYSVSPITTQLPAQAIGYHASLTVGDAKIRNIKSIFRDLPNLILHNSENGYLPEPFNSNKFYRRNSKDKFDSAILVFCPHKSENSPMGVKYIAPRLNEEFLKVGTFFGGDDEMVDQLEMTQSEAFQAKFINNDINTLVATKAFGMGIDKANIRSTVHFNFPASIESFVQEAGRAGRDKKRSICHILYTIDAPQIDENINNSFHSNNFKGITHDYEMILELLNEITYPSVKVKNNITSLVFENLGDNITINTWRNNGLERLYVNRAFQVSYGFINLSNLSINTQGLHPTIEPESAIQIIEFICSYIRENCPNSNYFEWLNSEVIANSQAGIERLFAGVPVGTELVEIEVGFRNNRIALITKLLHDQLDIRFTEWMVEKASDYCTDIDNFYANLVREFRKQYNEDITKALLLLYTNTKETLETYFYQIRDEIDTFKAVYRLSILNVIDDYYVDYSKKSMNLKIIKKTNQDYINSLENYLARYLSPLKVAGIHQRLDELDKGSIIRNCAFALIEFVYNFIGIKRKRAIKEMQGICEIGVASGDSDEIARTIGLYFNSKYTEELLEKTNGGIDSSLELVKEYMIETAGIHDNLEHLRGSTSRILADKPENGALLILRAYAGLLLETRYIRDNLIIRSQFLVDKALEDLDAGLLRFEEAGFNLLTVLGLVREELLSQNIGLSPLIEEMSLLYSVRTHKTWLSTFNKKYIN